MFMSDVYECYCAPFLRTNRVTVEFDKLHYTDLGKTIPTQPQQQLLS